MTLVDKTGRTIEWGNDGQLMDLLDYYFNGEKKDIDPVETGSCAVFVDEHSIAFICDVDLTHGTGCVWKNRAGEGFDPEDHDVWQMVARLEFDDDGRMNFARLEEVGC